MSATLHPLDNKFHKGNGGDQKHYWLTPPDLLADLHARYGFTFDPCPYPKPETFDGLTLPWGESNYVNPPFGSIIHEGKKKGPTAWARKAIAEHAKGKRVCLVYPIDKWVLMLLAAGATVRNLGDVRWLATEDGSQGKGTGRHIAEFLLEPSPMSAACPTCGNLDIHPCGCFAPDDAGTPPRETTPIESAAVNFPPRREVVRWELVDGGDGEPHTLRGPETPPAPPTEPEPRCVTCGGRENAAIHTIKGLKVSHTFIAQEPVETLAKQFHEAYERLAPKFGYETREASAKPWADVPESNRRLMTAVCAEVLASLRASLEASQRENAALRKAASDVLACFTRMQMLGDVTYTPTWGPNYSEALERLRSTLPPVAP